MASHLRARLALRVSTLSLLSALVAAPGFAQEREAGGFVNLGTIVITGEKVLRGLKDTASSVTLQDAEEIERKAGKDSVTEVIKGAANLIHPDNVGAPVIRGIDSQGPQNGQTAFFGGTVPRATINLDGHYLTYNETVFGATAAWDLANIEVFRGPQTTSQGANAIGGAIIVNTKDPSFTPEGAWRIEGGSYAARRASFAWSGPITDDLAVRIALDHSQRDTFITYGNPAFVRTGTDQDFASSTARVKFLWEPKELAGFSAKLTLAHSSTNRPTYEAASAPFGNLVHTAATMPTWGQRTNIAVLDLDQDFGNGWKLFSQSRLADTSVARITGLVDSGDAFVDLRTFSNETRATFGETGDRVSGMVGLFVSQTETDEELRLTGTYGNRTYFDDRKTNTGLFGEVSWRPADRWTVTAGLRFQQDRIERSGTTSRTLTALDMDTTFSALLPKLSVAYEVTPEWTVGAMVSHGYNPGGVSLNLTSNTWVEFREEKIRNYELFARGSLLDERLFLSANLFYMDFRDAQYNVPVEISPGTYQSYTINAEKSKSWGAEFGLDWQPNEDLTLRASAGFLKTKITEISANAAYLDKEFAKSPGYTLSLGADWQVNDRLAIGGQVRHVDGYFSDTTNTALYATDGYTVADVNISYALSDKLDVYGYVNNIFDERKPISMQNNRGIGGAEASMTSPRMIGIGLRGRF